MDSFSRIPNPRRSARFSGSVPFKLREKVMSREELLSVRTPDIKFIVEGRSIEAHSHILSRASYVFKVMFNGNFKTEPVIEVPDVNAQAFELVLKAIYGCSSAFTNVSAQLCMDSFLIAHKYNIEYIERMLCELIHKKIDVSNVFEVITLAQHVSMPHVFSKCWSVIERETKRAITSPGFLKTDWGTIHDVLENNHLTVREFDLAMAVWEWCKEQKRMLRRWENEPLISILGIAAYKIRFPLMTKKELGLIQKSGMLRDKDMEDLVTNFPKKRSNQIFSYIPRKNICFCQRHQSYKKCPLCTTKVLPRPLYQLYNLDVNNNSSAPAKLNTVIQKGPICHCRKYLSCPAFPNGASARILYDKCLLP